MEKTDALEALTALAHPTRLSVFRLLVREEPAGLAAGAIADALDVRANTLSTHLALLTRGGLVSAERHGRSIRYRVDLQGMRGLILYLTEDCCAGRPEICAPLMEALACQAETETRSCQPAARDFSDHVETSGR
jgi:DNA-binding transcriptional ArsR family regulator